MQQRDLVVGLYDAVEYWRLVRRTGAEQGWVGGYGLGGFKLAANSPKHADIEKARRFVRARARWGW